MTGGGRTPTKNPKQCRKKRLGIGVRNTKRQGKKMAAHGICHLIKNEKVERNQKLLKSNKDKWGKGKSHTPNRGGG